MLTAAAWNRSAEYDEQYTLFVTSNTPRPIWPMHVIAAADVLRVQADHAGFATIARNLRHSDVHPPLYFWAVAAWRWAGGDGLFAIRMLSVAFALGALAAVGEIARRCTIPPALAILLTLGCYGFAYTGSLARGFALAQALTLWGIVGMLGRRWLLAGVLLGCAVLANYLAVFVAGTAAMFGILTRTDLRASRAARTPAFCMSIGFLPPVLLAAWFFLHQRGSRPGQFPPFELVPALLRISRYSAANLIGGLPLYMPANTQTVVGAILTIGLVALAVSVLRRWGGSPSIAAAAMAPPLGLLALGFVFDNTPIELRYLSFATPFVALLVAGSRPRLRVLAIVCAVQAASLAGMILRPETMQPARAAAAATPDGGIVLIPRGNDGVGIVGAFAMEASSTLPLLLVGPSDAPADIRRRVGGYRRATLVLLAQDGGAQAAIPAMRAALAEAGWREIANGVNVATYERIAEPE